MEQSGGVFAEQVIRPTGLIDPPVEVRPAKTQVDDVLSEIREVSAKGYRTLVTVLTKRLKLVPPTALTCQRARRVQAVARGRPIRRRGSVTP